MTKTIQFGGNMLRVSECARITGLDPRTIYKRLAKGLPPDQATSTSLPRYPRSHGAESRAWKGGRTVMGPDNYIGVFLPSHPRSNGCGYVREHIVVAERALGKPLPADAVVHHVDEDQANNANSNLVICENNSYHRLLHVRMRILRFGGNPNLEKICGGCKSPVSRQKFNKLRRSSDGLASYCQDCGRRKLREFYRAKRGQ